LVAPALGVHLIGKLAFFTCTGLSLPSTMVGVLASTVTVTATGDDMSPTRSTARTANWCTPAARWTNSGEPQPFQAPPSSGHENVAGSLAANVQLASGPMTAPLAGPERIETTGGIVSYVQV